MLVRCVIERLEVVMPREGSITTEGKNRSRNKRSAMKSFKAGNMLLVHETKRRLNS